MALAPSSRASPSAADEVEKGRYLATAGNCAACHTAEDGAPFAGGLKFVTPFGDIYSTNITPDMKTGIGSWSADAFRTAMRCRRSRPPKNAAS